MKASYSADTDDLDAFAERSAADTLALAETYNNLFAGRSALAAAPLPFFVDQSHLNEFDRVIRFVDENGRFAGDISAALTGDDAAQLAVGAASGRKQLASTTGIDGGRSGMFGAMFNQTPGLAVLDQAAELDRWARQTLGDGSTRAAGAANHFFGADVFSRDGWSDFLATVAKSGMEIYSLNPSSAQHWQLAMSDPDEMRRRHKSFALGLWDGAKGLATFAHSASSLVAGTPSYAYEIHRWNETGEHRGFVLVDGLTQVSGQLSSLNPTSPTFHNELGEVWETKSITNHNGLQTAGSIFVSIIDWETFAEDPSRWAGRMTAEGIAEVATAAIPIGLSDNAGRAAVEAAEAATDLNKADNIVRSPDEVIQPAAPKPPEPPQRAPTVFDIPDRVSRDRQFKEALDSGTPIADDFVRQSIPDGALKPSRSPGEGRRLGDPKDSSKPTLQAENIAAQGRAGRGFEVRQMPEDDNQAIRLREELGLPEPPKSSRNPDLLVEDEWVDVYTPENLGRPGLSIEERSKRVIEGAFKKAKEGQAERVHIVLDRAGLSIEQVTNRFDTLRTEIGPDWASEVVHKDRSSREVVGSLKEISIELDGVWVVIFP